jgi:hypothetical protein
MATFPAVNVELPKPTYPAVTVAVPDVAGPHCQNRQIEWMMVIGFAIFGLQTFIWPQSIKMSAFEPILNIAWPWVLATFAMVLATSRGFALYRNGLMPVLGPWIRIIGAAIGFIMMASMAFALALQVMKLGRPPSPGVPFYLALCWAEYRSAKRAASDVRYRKLR